MRRLFWILVLFFFASGCSSITYEGEDGKFCYTRIGTQSISGLKVQRQLDGSFLVYLDKGDGSTGDLAEALANVSAVAKSMAK